jgi:hypothetical protein
MALANILDSKPLRYVSSFSILDWMAGSGSSDLNILTRTGGRGSPAFRSEVEVEVEVVDVDVVEWSWRKEDSERGPSGCCCCWESCSMNLDWLSGDDSLISVVSFSVVGVGVGVGMSRDCMPLAESMDLMLSILPFYMS